MDNIPKSEKVIAKVLSLLMEWGIQNCQLEFDELELDESFGEFFFPCIYWLEAEGVIRTTEISVFSAGGGTGIVFGPVLTSYGMKVMGMSLDVGEKEINVSEAVSKVSSGNAQYANAGNFAGGLLAAFIKSIG